MTPRGPRINPRPTFSPPPPQPWRPRGLLGSDDAPEYPDTSSATPAAALAAALFVAYGRVDEGNYQPRVLWKGDAARVLAALAEQGWTLVRANEIDVERLARAIKWVTEGTPGWLASVDHINSPSDVEGLARALAAEYASQDDTP